MAVEIERKFLVKNDAWRESVESESHIMQGYLAADANVTVRVRIKGDAAYLTIKGPTQGFGRSEYEYPIPAADGAAMLKELPIFPVIDKTRFRVRCGAHVWDLDVFAGANAGLVMAEVELGSEDESFEMPEWAGEEVSADGRYYNANLARVPYSQW